MIIKIKEKRLDRAGKYFAQVLYLVCAKGLFKSFGVQSRVGRVGNCTGLISQRPCSGLVGSIFFTKIPHPAHIICMKYKIGEKNAWS